MTGYGTRTGRLAIAVMLATAVVMDTAPASDGLPDTDLAPVPNDTDAGQPIDGLLADRPDGLFPLPPVRPALIDVVAGSCVPEQPELLWGSLPQDMRTVDLGTMIGQLLVTSFLGDSLDDDGVQRAIDALADGRIGGVLFFRHNVGSVDELVALTTAIREANPTLEPFVAVDQEGGAVARLGEAEGVPKLPSARDVTDLPLEEARDRFEEMAAALAALGFNLNLAPVVDLDLNPDNPVIARFGRAFSANADTVTDYAGAFVDAHRAAGVLTALKHFPGHGSSLADSHDGTADVTRTWRKGELEPFERLIAGGRADLVMAGHLMLQNVDPGDGGPVPPATLSSVLLRDILRNGLCFDGLIVSDDLNMKAIADDWPLADAIVAALGAGNDLVIASIGGDGDVREVADIIEAVRVAAEDDPALAAAIRHAYARVVHFKLDREMANALPRSVRPEEMPVVPILTRGPSPE